MLNFLNYEFQKRYNPFSLPQVLIFSTQRSGAHLLEAFLSSHTQIHARGEIFDSFQKNKSIQPNKTAKVNIAILMYNQFTLFQELGGNLNELKVLHLLRDPLDVAKSRAQVAADKKLHGTRYRAHQLKYEPPQKKGVPDLSNLDDLIKSISQEQQKYIDMLKNIGHLQLSYEEIAVNGQNAEFLDEGVQEKLLRYLDLQEIPFKMSTHLVKTGKPLGSMAVKS